MKNFLCTLLAFVMVSLSVLADDKQEALKTFNEYVKAANNYNTVVTYFYSPSAKIIRQVIMLFKRQRKKK